MIFRSFSKLSAEPVGGRSYIDPREPLEKVWIRSLGAAETRQSEVTRTVDFEGGQVKCVQEVSVSMGLEVDRGWQVRVEIRLFVSS